MANITQEGTFKVQIKSVEIIEPRFDDMPQGSFEFKFDIVNDQGDTGEIFLEYSTRMGRGNMAAKSQMQITMEALQSLGWQAGQDFSQIGSLIGKIATVNAKKNTKGYLNLYFSGGFEVKPLSPAEIQRRVALMSQTAKNAPAQPFGQQPAALGQPPASFGQPAPTPFGQPAQGGGFGQATPFGR